MPVLFASDSLIPSSISSLIHSLIRGHVPTAWTQTRASSTAYQLYRRPYSLQGPFGSTHRHQGNVLERQAFSPYTAHPVRVPHSLSAQVPRNRIAVGVMLIPKVLRKPALLPNLHRSVIVAVVVHCIAASEFNCFRFLTHRSKG